MAIQKVSDLEGLNLNTASKENLKESLIEITYLNDKDDNNHRWYKSMSLRCEDLAKLVGGSIGGSSGGTRTYGDFNINDVDESGNDTEYDEWSKYNSLQKFDTITFQTNQFTIKDKNGKVLFRVDSSGGVTFGDGIGGDLIRTESSK